MKRFKSTTWLIPEEKRGDAVPLPLVWFETAMTHTHHPALITLATAEAG